MVALAAASLAHGPHWWVGALVLALVVFAPAIYALAVALRTSSTS